MPSVKNVRWVAAVGVVWILSIAGSVMAADGGTSDAGARDGGQPGDAAADRASHDGASTVTDAALAPPTHAVGKSCKKDGDCAPGLTCLTPETDSLGRGGPPGGMCTVSCLHNAQADCDRVDTGSLCATSSNGAIAWCYEACTFGAPPEGKCHDRVDFGCEPPQLGGSAFCAPMCRNDGDCGGRVCDLGTGLCANAVSGSLPVGTACDPSMSGPSCIGSCATLGNGEPTMDNSFCTFACTLGRAGTCGVSPTATGPQQVGCVFKFASNATDGDLGDCGQLCDCDSDCKNPGFVCHDNALAHPLGHSGACVPKLTFDGVTQGMSCGAEPPHHVSEAGAPVDAAAPLDAGTDASLTPVSATGGCSCRTAGGTPAQRAPALLAILALCLGLRRRNARQTPPKR